MKLWITVSSFMPLSIILITLFMAELKPKVVWVLQA